MEGLIAHRGAQLLPREALLDLPTPEATETHKPIPHARVVEALIESLDFRHIAVVEDQYAVTPDGSRMFGVLQINVEDSGVRLALGIRNSHDKSLSLAFTVGYRVFVCDNLAFHGDFHPVSRKHSKWVDCEEVVDAAVARMQRHFEPLRGEINAWRQREITDPDAKLLIYDAFVAGRLAVPRRLIRRVHEEYFHPVYPEFEPRTLWSLSNAFTSALKQLAPIPRYQATAKLGGFLTDYPLLGPEAAYTTFREL